jgi:hypothetical protein
MKIPGIQSVGGYAGEVLESLTNGLDRVGEQRTFQADLLNHKGSNLTTINSVLIDISEDGKRKVIEIDIAIIGKESISTLFFKDSENLFFPARVWKNTEVEKECQSSIYFQSDAIPAIFFEEQQKNHVSAAKIIFNKIILQP